MSINKNFRQQPVVFILSISSGIGLELAKRYLSEGYCVVGTFRDKSSLTEISAHPNCLLWKCDIANRKNVTDVASKLKKSEIKWGTFISCVGILKPLSRFFKENYIKWNKAVEINCLDQLQILHAVYPYRNTAQKSNVVFFAGSGTNNSVVNMSSYIAPKILLMKMCELLDAENDDLKVFIVGPGWTNTKAHKQVLEDKNTPKEKYEETERLFQTQKWTDFQDIYDCIQWLCRQEKKAVGGRNFSVIHDLWKKPDDKRLKELLLSDPNMYKLRRYKNECLTKEATHDKIKKNNTERRVSVRG